MPCLAISAGVSAPSLAGRSTRRVSSRRPLICKAEVETVGAPSALKAPEWLPEQAAPVFAFLTSDDFSITESAVYTQYLKKYVEDEYFVQSTGFKALPETINGRAAMIGFLAGAGAEIFGAGPLMGQLSRAPQPALVIMALVTAGSIIPIIKGAKGEYLASLRETYTLPEGVFTEALERLHGRLAMLGVGGLILLELLKGSAVL